MFETEIDKDGDPKGQIDECSDRRLRRTRHYELEIIEY